MKICLSCLERKEAMSDAFVCTDCVDTSSERTSVNLKGRHLVRALRALGAKVHKVDMSQAIK